MSFYLHVMLCSVLSHVFLLSWQFLLINKRQRWFLSFPDASKLEDRSIEYYFVTKKTAFLGIILPWSIFSCQFWVEHTLVSKNNELTAFFVVIAKHIKGGHWKKIISLCLFYSQILIKRGVYGKAREIEDVWRWNPLSSWGRVSCILDSIFKTWRSILKALW